MKVDNETARNLQTKRNVVAPRPKGLVSRAALVLGLALAGPLATMSGFGTGPFGPLVARAAQTPQDMRKLPAPTPDTARIAEHHRRAWDARDLEAILADYSDDSVVIVVDKVYRGRAEIRGLFVELFRIFDVSGPQVMTSSFSTGNILYFTWHTTYLGQDIRLGTDTFVISGGHIAYQTISSERAIFGTLMN